MLSYYGDIGSIVKNIVSLNEKKKLKMFKNIVDRLPPLKLSPIITMYLIASFARNDYVCFARTKNRQLTTHTDKRQIEPPYCDIILN